MKIPTWIIQTPISGPKFVHSRIKQWHKTLSEKVGFPRWCFTAQNSFQSLKEAPKQTLCSLLTSDMLDIASYSMLKTSCTVSGTSVARTKKWHPKNTRRSWRVRVWLPIQARNITENCEIPGPNFCTFHLDPSIIQRFSVFSARIYIRVFLRLEWK